MSASKRMSHGSRASASSTRTSSAQEVSGARPRGYYDKYHWRQSDAGSRPAPRLDSSSSRPGPSRRSSDDGERVLEGQGKRSRAQRTEYDAGPSRGQGRDDSRNSATENQAENGTDPRPGTGRRPGAAPWPENMPTGRQPVWAVPAREWLVLQPAEPMEVGARDEEEPMEVDPPRPQQTWDSPGSSLKSILKEHRQLCRRARQAPYSASPRLRSRH